MRDWWDGVQARLIGFTFLGLVLLFFLPPVGVIVLGLTAPFWLIGVILLLPLAVLPRRRR